MSPLYSHDGIRSANQAAVELLQTLSSVESVPAEIVMVHDDQTDTWRLHLGECTDDLVRYHCDLPDTVHNTGELVGYLTSDEWIETLFRMSQDFDAWHGPNPVQLD